MVLDSSPFDEDVPELFGDTLLKGLQFSNDCEHLLVEGQDVGAEGLDLLVDCGEDGVGILDFVPDYGPVVLDVVAEGREEVEAVAEHFVFFYELVHAFVPQEGAFDGTVEHFFHQFWVFLEEGGDERRTDFVAEQPLHDSVLVAVLEDAHQFLLYGQIALELADLCIDDA